MAVERRSSIVSSRGRATRVCLLFAPMITTLTDIPVYPSALSVLYPPNSHPSTTGFRLAHYLIATILYWIWAARNLATFRNRILSLSIANLIKQDIANRVRCEPVGSVQHLWSFRRVLCSVNAAGKCSIFPQVAVVVVICCDGS